MAGRTCCSSTRQNWPGRPGPRSAAGAVSKQPGRVRRHHSRVGTGCAECTESVRPPPTTTTTARSTSTSRRSAATGCSGISAPASSRTSPAQRALPTAASRRARSGSTTTPTAGRPVRRALRRVVDREGSVLHAGRQEQVLLHAGILQGPESVALPESRQRHVRERDEAGRHLRHVLERPRRGDARFRRRQPDGSVRRQRHRAEPPVPQQGQRHVRGRRGRRRRRLQRVGRGAGGHGRRRQRLRRLGASQPHHRQLRQPDDGALSQRGPRPLHRRCAEVRRSAGRRS